MDVSDVNHCHGSCASQAKLLDDEVRYRAATLRENWRVVDGRHLQGDFTFPNFREALAFANRIGELAEQYGHHPEMCVSWGRVRLRLFTHTCSGLTDSDFVLADAASQLTG